MASIFISYRRDDSKADARDLQNRLQQAFGRLSVFMDVDNLKAGQRFDQELATALDQCDVLLAIIGARWMDIFNERQAGGQRDYVRDEIAAALERDAIVIPVLVEDAPLPMAASLPRELRKLLLYQAHQITHKRFGRDVADLVEAIKQSRRARQSSDTRHGRWSWGRVMIPLAVAVIGLALYFAPGLWRGSERAELKVMSGTFFRDCPIVCPDVVVIPPGNFTMGSNDGEANETPARQVAINKPFAAGRFEVTFEEWDACFAAGGCTYKPDSDWGRGRQPVVGVSWKDAQTYASWLSVLTGKHYRLLTEAEWEYAARAQTTTKYAFGDKLTVEQAQFSESPGGVAFDKSGEVGKFKPNAFGLYDMHGNVAEWVEDCFHENYREALADTPERTNSNCTRRAVRGGSWRNHPSELRSSSRRGLREEYRYNFLGFRVARAL